MRHIGERLARGRPGTLRVAVVQIRGGHRFGRIVEVGRRWLTDGVPHGEHVALASPGGHRTNYCNT